MSNFTTQQRRDLRSYANAAVRNGYLKFKPCEVCGTIYAIEKHHPDYHYPLEVIWLCKEHYQALHRGKIDENSLQISYPEYPTKKYDRGAFIEARLRKRRATELHLQLHELNHTENSRGFGA